MLLHPGILASVLTAVLLTVVVVAVSLGSVGPQTASALETIQSIPYPRDGAATVVTEQLAHADLYLGETVLAKSLTVTLHFRPYKQPTLALGVRENSFWLSYDPIVFYTAGQDALPPDALRTATVTIPLTNKLAAADGSLDLMFFAGTPAAAPDTADRTTDTTYWVLEDWQVATAWAWPTRAAVKDFLRSITARERPL